MWDGQGCVALCATPIGQPCMCEPMPWLYFVFVQSLFVFVWFTLAAGSRTTPRWARARGRRRRSRRRGWSVSGRNWRRKRRGKEEAEEEEEEVKEEEDARGGGGGGGVSVRRVHAPRARAGPCGRQGGSERLDGLEEVHSTVTPDGEFLLGVAAVGLALPGCGKPGAGWERARALLGVHARLPAPRCNAEAGGQGEAGGHPQTSSSWGWFEATTGQSSSTS